MSKDEFFDQLALTRGQFAWVIYSGEIRATTNHVTATPCMLCPITAVCVSVGLKERQTWDFGNAGQELGLPKELVNKVVLASDCNDPDVDKDLREELLKNLHLEEG